jgi:hypothetical protein
MVQIQWRKRDLPNYLPGMIYSRFAHTNRGEHDLFETMTTHPFGYMLAMDEFLRCIRVVHAGLLFVNKLNADAFPQIGA